MRLCHKCIGSRYQVTIRTCDADIQGYSFANDVTPDGMTDEWMNCTKTEADTLCCRRTVGVLCKSVPMSIFMASLRQNNCCND